MSRYHSTPATVNHDMVTITLTVTWKMRQKMWRVDVRYWTGSHWASYFKMVDTTAELDQMVAGDLMNVAVAHIESLLF